MCEKCSTVSDVILARGKNHITALIATLTTEQLLMAKYVMDTGLVTALEEVDDFLKFAGALEMLLPADKHNELIEFCKKSVDEQIKEDAFRELGKAIEEMSQQEKDKEDSCRFKEEQYKELRRYLAGECDEY